MQPALRRPLRERLDPHRGAAIAFGGEGDNLNTVLVVSDRPEQASALAERLGIIGVEAIASARDWKLAVRKLVANRVAVILTDIDSSEESLSFFETIQELSGLPVIVRGPGSDTGLVMPYLERGAVDYISKTTTVTLLADKIQTMMRLRLSSAEADAIVFAGDLSIDLSKRTVVKGIHEVSLTPLEYRLLSVLAENVGRPCKREELLRRVWGADFASCSHYLRLYIGYLRQKLEENPRRPQLLLTEWGYGYRLNEADQRRGRVFGRTELRLASNG